MIRPFQPLCQRAVEIPLAGATLSRFPRTKPVATKFLAHQPVAPGAICGCLWDTMGCHGGQWETIVKAWEFRVLGGCGKLKASSSGTKRDQHQVKTAGSQNIAAKRCSFSVLMKEDVYARFGRKSARRPISRVLSRPLAGPWMTIPLGRPLPDASRDLPGRRRRKRAWPAPVPCGIGRPAAPMRSCSRWGLPCRPRYRRRGALLPHPFTLTGGAALAGHGNRRFAFCGTFPGVAPAGHYPAPCFRGARTFLDPAVAGEAAVIQPSGEGRGRDAGRRSQPEARSRISSSPS